MCVLRTKLISTELSVTLFGRKKMFPYITLKVWPVKLSCLGNLVGRVSGAYAVCYGFEFCLWQLMIILSVENIASFRRI